MNSVFSAEPAISLDHVKPGDVVRVGRVDGARPFRRRLLELGFVPGTPLVVVGHVPLGDLVRLRVRGAVVALRRADARRIEVVA